MSLEGVGRKTGLRTKLIGLLTAVLVLITVVFLFYAYEDQRQRAERELLEESRVLVAEMDAVWDFISLNQNTINYDSDGAYDYKGIHCAIAGKSVAALFSERSEYSIRFTNLNPRNIYNRPDTYETAALETFLRDSSASEMWGFEEEGGKPVFRYVEVMKVSDACVDCHGRPAGEIDETGYMKEGWDVGDVAGAVSVVVPAESALESMRAAVATNVVFFLLVATAMVVIIYVVISRMVTEPLTALRSAFSRVADQSSPSGTKGSLGPAGEEAPLIAGSLDSSPLFTTREIDGLVEQYRSMAERLNTLYDSLESQVAERTEQLQRANDELEQQRKRVEEINERLQRDSRYKSDFLAIVSHELRTPLTSILAFTDLLEQEISPDNEAAVKQLDEIDKNGALLLEMVDNVLECARIQAGSESVNLELIDLNDIVGMIEAAMSPVAVKKGVLFETRVSAAVPLIESDWEKLRRAIVNLVSNAVKFTPSGGRVTLEVEYESPAQLLRSDRWRSATFIGGEVPSGGGVVAITVTDSGIGIPADKHVLVFERFRQENMSTVRRYGGSGLGLSLVRDLVAMLEGCVTLRSAPGEGSTFSLYVPVAFEGGIDD
ncbi:DUF3365 domain-containing protein [Adlercreutzia sp. R25]|uniref:ATP-binding protein n=1 Tax=Adlercreutzia shanghongiae TaxID=3111773 RepID=UPI002DB5FB9E|nr:DUF3365 domain-containing protein [Adlercreutzia sp. R25]MEC4272321.1 DUF3365 domain-containing protein [Adlercreutzia sp. R25]